MQYTQTRLNTNQWPIPHGWLFMTTMGLIHVLVCPGRNKGWIQEFFLGELVVVWCKHFLRKAAAPGCHTQTPCLGKINGIVHAP